MNYFLFLIQGLENFDKFLSVDVFQLDIRNPVNLIAGKRFKVKKVDIIFIPPTEIVKWNRTISLLLPQTDLFNSYNPVIQNGVKSGTTSNLTEQPCNLENKRQQT